MSRHKLAGRQTVRQAHADRQTDMQADWQAQADRQINKHRQSTGWQAHWLTGTGRQTYTDWQANTDWQADRQKDKHREANTDLHNSSKQQLAASPPRPPSAVHQTLFTFYLHPPHKCGMLNISMNIYTFSIHLHLHDPPLSHRMRNLTPSSVYPALHYTSINDHLHYYLRDVELYPIICLQRHYLPDINHQTLFTFYLHPPHKCSMLNISMNIYTIYDLLIITWEMWNFTQSSVYPALHYTTQHHISIHSAPHPCQPGWSPGQ